MIFSIFIPLNAVAHLSISHFELILFETGIHHNIQFDWWQPSTHHNLPQENVGISLPHISNSSNCPFRPDGDYSILEDRQIFGPMQIESHSPSVPFRVHTNVTECNTATVLYVYSLDIQAKSTCWQNKIISFNILETTISDSTWFICHRGNQWILDDKDSKWFTAFWLDKIIIMHDLL